MQPEAVMIPLQNFELIAAAVAEYIKALTEWIQIKCFFD